MTIYPSKISYGLLIAIGIIFFLPISIEGFNNGTSNHFLITMSILVLVFIIILYTFYSTKYSINKNILHIKCGFLYNDKINIQDIKTIEKTKSLLSSPAASFDRIIVTFGKYDEIILSPQNKVDFVRSLQKINPQIKSSILH